MCITRTCVRSHEVLLCSDLPIFSHTIMMNLLRPFGIVLLALAMLTTTSVAQKKKPAKKKKAATTVVAPPDDRVDTTRVSNLTPGMEAKVIQSYAEGAPIDTMMWGGRDGASILRFDGKFLGYRGRYVIGLKGDLIDQVAFNMIPMSKEEADAAFAKAKPLYYQALGTPVEESMTPMRMIVWRGKKLELKLQTKDDVAYFAIVLTYGPPPKSQPKTGPKNWWEK